MIVSGDNFDTVLAALRPIRNLGFDTETSGVRPYHGDRLFSLIISHLEPRPESKSFYFNFQSYPGLESHFVLRSHHLQKLGSLFADPEKSWDAHWAKFDIAMLHNEGIEVAGTVHCTKAMARVEYNEHQDYDLASVAAREGLKKDDAVERYITEHKLFEKVSIPGKKAQITRKFFDRVPFPIISDYGLIDGLLPRQIGAIQRKRFEEIDHELKGTGLPGVSQVAANERRLTKTVVRMERVGLRIDPQYCVRASQYEADRTEKALQGFKRETGRDFVASGKLFAELFAGEKEKWDYTEKGNPSFEGEVLERLNHPAARLILDYREAKSKRDFYEGFLYHADRNSAVHPSWNPDDTRTGRFSSSHPNFQNLTSEAILKCQACGKGQETVVPRCEKCGSEKLETPPFLIRRAIVPRPGFILFMPDYVQMEYKMALDYACVIVGHLTPLAKRVVDGEDVHQAVADLIVAHSGKDIGRSHAKNVNFATLYGAWIKTLAKMIGCTFEEAKVIWDAVAAIAPELDQFSEAVKKTAAERGYIRNWLGRRSYFRDPSDAYKAPNSLIQGGCADTNKRALNSCDEYLLGRKSRLIATIHDENWVEVHESEVSEVPTKIIQLMEKAYPHKFVPLTASAEWSSVSAADKVKGLPHG